MKLKLIRTFLFALILAPLLCLNAQAVWKNNGKGVTCVTMDEGVVISSNVENNMYFDSLYKVDRMGDTLWTLEIDTTLQFYAEIIIEDSLSGELYLGGAARYPLGSGDNIGAIMKIDACGDMLWYTELEYEDYHHHRIHDMELKEDRLMILQNVLSTPGYTPELILSEISLSGTENWKKFYNEYSDEYSDGGHDVRFIACMDGGYLLTGEMFVGPYLDTVAYPLKSRSYSIKVDSLGEKEWDYIANWESDSLGGYNASRLASWVQLMDSSYIICTPEISSTSSLIMNKLSPEGDLLWSNQSFIDTTGMYDKLSLNLLNDSTIFIVGSYSEYPANGAYSRIFFLQADTSGAVLDTELYSGLYAHLPRGLQLGQDNIMAISATDTNIYSYLNRSIYKVNAETMQLVTYPLVDTNEYDPFCVDGVVVDPLDLEEHLSGITTDSELHLSPNPASKYINLASNFTSESTVVIHDFYGRSIKEIKCSDGAEMQLVDISELVSGLYFVQLFDGGIPVQTVKLIVE